jgi:hypothetical protein
MEPVWHREGEQPIDSAVVSKELERLRRIRSGDQSDAESLGAEEIAEQAKGVGMSADE